MNFLQSNLYTPPASAPSLNATQNGTPGALTVGGIVFDDDEHPTQLPLGVTQALSKKITIGGGKVVQALGTIHKDITWTGKLYDARAQPKVASLLSLADSGQQVALTVLGVYGYNVVVEDFTATLLYEWEYDYSITVTVISSISGLTGASTPVTVDTQVQALLTQAQLTAAQLVAQDNNAANAQESLAQVAAELAALRSVAGGAAQNGSLLTTIAAALTSAQMYSVGAQAYANGGAQTLVNLLTLIQRNVQVGQSQTSIASAGANWAELAAQFYGDASLAPTLAAANGSASAIRLSTGVFQNIIIPNLTKAA